MGIIDHSSSQVRRHLAIICTKGLQHDCNTKDKSTSLEGHSPSPVRWVSIKHIKCLHIIVSVP